MTTQPNPLPKYAQSGDVLAEGYLYRYRQWGFSGNSLRRDDSPWYLVTPNHGTLYTTAKNALSANGKGAKVLSGADNYIKLIWDPQENCWSVERKYYDITSASHFWKFTNFMEFEAVKVKMVVE